MSVPDDDTLLAIVAVCLKQIENENKRKLKRKRIRMQARYKNRDKLTQQQLLKEIKVNELNDLVKHLRMDCHTFEELLSLLSPQIKKQNILMRTAIPASARLLMTLSFLANGSNLEDMNITSKISPSAITKIVLETCKAIIERLKDYIKVPQSPQEWQLLAHEFYTKTNFPNCLGVVGGKHIAIEKPASTDAGSGYYNYKQFFSIVILGVVNADYEFILTDVGLKGGLSSGAEALHRSALRRDIYRTKLNMPNSRILTDSEIMLPYVFIGDDSMELTEHFLNPFPLLALTREQQIFNFRLVRVRSIVENTFAIMSTRFKVLHKTIKLSPKKVQTIVLACCYLHNYLRRKSPEYLGQDGVFDAEDIADDETELTPLQSIWTENGTKKAKQVRNNFMDYFNKEETALGQSSMMYVNYS